MELDFKIFRMNRLEIPQERIAKRLEQARETIRNHLAKMPELANQPKADLSRGFTVPQVAEKHGWTEPMVWSIALDGKSDLDRFKALNWGLRTWDLWNWNDCDKRFGDDWPARHLPARALPQAFPPAATFGNRNVASQFVSMVLLLLPSPKVITAGLKSYEFNPHQMNALSSIRNVPVKTLLEKLSRKEDFQLEIVGKPYRGKPDIGLIFSDSYFTGVKSGFAFI